MHSVNLFELASQQARWTTVRQQAVANNVANSNTVGYRPVEVEPFREVLNKDNAGGLIATHPNHIRTADESGGFRTKLVESDPLSGETPKVSVEQQLIEAGDVRRTYELNTAIVKSFHRMILMTVRS